MNLTIRTPAGNQTVYTLRGINVAARAAARSYPTVNNGMKARYVRHWVEVNDARVTLRVEVKRADGLGDITGMAL